MLSLQAAQFLQAFLRKCLLLGLAFSTSVDVR